MEEEYNTISSVFLDNPRWFFLIILQPRRIRDHAKNFFFRYSERYFRVIFSFSSGN